MINSITRSPAYADPNGREAVGTLIDATSKRLPPADAMRFDSALDAVNVSESWAEGNFEHYIQEPVVTGWEEAKARGKAALTGPTLKIKYLLGEVAERVGFEPTEGLTLRRFSRPVP